jgi:hypothetical protein
LRSAEFSFLKNPPSLEVQEQASKAAVQGQGRNDIRGTSQTVLDWRSLEHDESGRKHPDSPFQRYAKLAKAMVSVSKKDADEKVAGRRQKRQTSKRKGN